MPKKKLKKLGATKARKVVAKAKKVGAKKVVAKKVTVQCDRCNDVLKIPPMKRGHTYAHKCGGFVFKVED